MCMCAMCMCLSACMCMLVCIHLCLSVLNAWRDLDAYRPYEACLSVLCACASLLVPAFVCAFSCAYVCAGFYIPPCIILDDVEFVVLYLHF